MIRRFELVCDARCPASCHAVCYGKTKEQAIAQLINHSTFCDQFDKLNIDTFAVLSESEVDLTTIKLDKVNELFGQYVDESYKHVVANLQELVSIVAKMRTTDITGELVLYIDNYNATNAIDVAAQKLLARLDATLAARVERC